MRKNLATICLVVLSCLCSHDAQALDKRALIGGISVGIGVVGTAISATFLGLYMRDQYVNGYTCSDGILSSNAQAQCCDVSFPYVSNCSPQDLSARPPCGSKTATCKKSNGGYEYASVTYTSEAQRAQIASGVSMAVSILAGGFGTILLIHRACYPQRAGGFTQFPDVATATVSSTS